MVSLPVLRLLSVRMPLLSLCSWAATSFLFWQREGLGQGQDRAGTVTGRRYNQDKDMKRVWT